MYVFIRDAVLGKQGAEETVNRRGQTPIPGSFLLPRRLLRPRVFIPGCLSALQGEPPDAAQIANSNMERNLQQAPNGHNERDGGREKKTRRPLGSRRRRS